MVCFSVDSQEIECLHWEMVERAQALKSINPGSDKSQLCLLLAMWPWASLFASLGFVFLSGAWCPTVGKDSRVIFSQEDYAIFNSSVKIFVPVISTVP